MAKPAMSLKVCLLFNFPQYKVLALSIVIITVGVCSIGATAFGFWLKILGYYLASGAWSGGFCVVTGSFGIFASHSKGICSVHTFMVFACLACVVSAAQITLSALAFIVNIGFYTQPVTANPGISKLIHGLLIGFGFFQCVLCLTCAIICMKLVCCFKPHCKKGDPIASKNNFIRGEVRASTSSHAPLVSKEKSHRAENIFPDQSIRLERATASRDRNGHLNHLSRDKEQTVVGRRFGNVPVVGSNVVELIEKQEQNRVHTVDTTLRHQRPRPRSSRSPTRAPKPVSRHSYHERQHSFSSRRSSERESLIRDNSKIYTRAKKEFTYADGVESPDKEDAKLISSNNVVSSSSVDDSLTWDQPVIHNRSTDRCSTLSFIPIENAIEQPLSIEEDEFLPPYEDSKTYRRSVSDKMNSNNENDSSPVLSAADNKQELSNFKEPKNVIDDQVSSTPNNDDHLNSVPLPDPVVFSEDVFSSSVTPLLATAEEFHENFVGHHDPQGVSYCAIRREKEHISDTELLEKTGSLTHQRGRSLSQKDHETCNTTVAKCINGDASSSSHPNMTASPKIDQRRMSLLSTMSLPTAFPPPKPPRLFHVDYLSLKNFNRSCSNETLTSPKSEDSLNSAATASIGALSKGSTRALNTSPSADKNKTSLDSNTDSGVGNSPVRDLLEQCKPLSVEIDLKEDQVSSVHSVPYAHSSPKVKDWNMFTLPQSPGMSPITKSLPSDRARTLERDCQFRKNDRGKDSDSAFSQSKSKDDDPLSLRPYLYSSEIHHATGNKRNSYTDASLSGFNEKESKVTFPSLRNVGITYNVGNNNKTTFENNSPVLKSCDKPSSDTSKFDPGLFSKPKVALPIVHPKPLYSSQDIPAKLALRSKFISPERKIPLPSSCLTPSFSPMLSVWKGNTGVDFDDRASLDTDDDRKHVLEKNNSDHIDKLRLSDRDSLVGRNEREKLEHECKLAQSHGDKSIVPQGQGGARASAEQADMDNNNTGQVLPSEHRQQGTDSTDQRPSSQQQNPQGAGKPKQPIYSILL